MRDFAAADWPVRIPVTVRSQVAAGTAIRVDVSIDKEHAPFWDYVDSNGYRIKFGDGKSDDLTWSRTSWDYAAKDATLRVDYTTPTGSGTSDNVTLYMYVGHEDTTPDLAGSPSNTTAKSAKPQAADAFPIVLRDPGKVITNESTPTIEVGGTAKDLSVGETVMVFVPLGARLLAWRDGTNINGSPEVETPQWVSAAVYDSAAASLANWYDADNVDLAYVAGVGFGVVVTLTPDSEDDARLTVTVGTSLANEHLLHVRLAAATPTL